MSVHESKSSDTSSERDVTTNVGGVVNGMEWDAEERKNNVISPSSSIENGEYELSAQLDGFDYGVRDVACSGNDVIGAIEEKGRAGVFVRTGPNTFQVQEGIEAQIHAALAFVIANVEGCKMKGESRPGQAQQYYPKATFMSGGGDKAARPFTSNGTTFNALAGHNGPVNSISFTHPDRLVVTGSWDGIVRVWHGEEMIRVFDKLGHEHGTEVLGLENGTIVTASTNKHIVIVDASNGSVVKRVSNAHNGPIRKLIAHPLGFASAANDGTVKVWTSAGEPVATIDAHTSSEVKFIYGLCYLPGRNNSLEESRLVTCGEDGFVRLFDFKGTPLQSFGHAGPVRSVKPLGSEGDFVSACSDKKVRIFTRAPERFASEKERKDFREIGELVKASGMKALDTSTLEDESALATPGTKNGQIKVLRVAGRTNPIAYQWSDDLQQWVEIGETLGSSGSNGPQKGKSKLEGVEYDFVSDVWLTEEQKVQLGFNADDDPDEVTDRFMALYQIPADMRGQIYGFVAPKVDMERVAMRKSRLQSEQSSAIVLQQVPSWNGGSYEMYGAANFAAMEKKITETNAILAQQSHAFAIHGDELRTFRVLFENIKDVTQYHSREFSSAEHTVMKKLVQWPNEHILAIMDAVRVLMLHTAANTALGDDATVTDCLFAHVREGKAKGKDTYQVLMLKIVSNWLAKRQRGAYERSTPAQVAPNVIQFIVRVLSELADCAGSQSENIALAYVMLLHNLMCWFGRLRIVESELYPLVAAGVCELLKQARNSKIQFYALLTIGTIAYASTPAKDLVKASFAQPLTAFITQGAGSDNAALKQVAHDCKLLYQL